MNIEAITELFQHIHDKKGDDQSPIVVGFTGPKGVGKSTFSNFLANELIDKGITCYKTSYASPIKEWVNECLYAWRGSNGAWEDLNKGVNFHIDKDLSFMTRLKFKVMRWQLSGLGAQAFECGYSPDKEQLRPFYQKTGDLVRKDDQEHFVQLMLDRINMEDWKGVDVVIIDDVRYPNEAELCDVVISLSRSGVEYTLEHSSETPLDPQYVHLSIDLDRKDKL